MHLCVESQLRRFLLATPIQRGSFASFSLCARPIYESHRERTTVYPPDVRPDPNEGVETMRDGFKVIDADRHVLEPIRSVRQIFTGEISNRVEIKGPNQSYRWSTAKNFRRRQLRDVTKQEDFGFTFGASKRWRETFAEALAANSIRRRTFATWIKKASTSACFFPPSASTSCGATISTPNLAPRFAAPITPGCRTIADYNRKRLNGVALIPLQIPSARSRN